MPDSSHPPYATGALTIPRMLIRWLDVNAQNGPLTRTMTYVTLPSFNATVNWAGYSTIVTTFNSEGPNNFSIKSAIAPSVPPNYTLCISFTKGGVLTRYLVWLATGSVMPYSVPLYSGQPIQKNFRFEVWSTSQGNASQAKALQFYTSVAGQLDYRYGTDSLLVGNDGQVTNFNYATAAPNYNIALPVSVMQWYSPTYGITLSGPNVTSWASYINTGINQTLTVKSSTWLQAGTPVLINPVSPGTLGYTAIGGITTQAIVFVFKLAGFATRTIYNNGNGFTFSVNFNGTITVNGNNGLQLPLNTCMLAVVDSQHGVIDGQQGLASIYNLNTGVLIGSLGFPIFTIGPDGNVIYGADNNIGLGDLVCFYAGIANTAALYTQYVTSYLTYFSAIYNAGNPGNTLNLPLTLPANSVSTTN